jgi:hypothetical protein
MLLVQDPAFENHSTTSMGGKGHLRVGLL